MTDAPPVAKPAAAPFDTDEKTVHVPGHSDTHLSATVDGRAGSKAGQPQMTIDAPPEKVPKVLRPAETLDEPAPGSKPTDTLDDPPPRIRRPATEPSLESLAPVASVSDVEPMLPPQPKPPPPTKVPEVKGGSSLDALAPLPRMLLDKRVVAGLPVALALGLTLWAFSAPDVAPPEPILLPPAPVSPVAVEQPSTGPMDLSGVYLDVPVGGGKTERRPAGKVKLFSNPVATVTTAKGQKLGKTPTEVTAEVGPLELLFENRELGINKSVTINVRGGMGGKETVEFPRGWLDIDAPSGSKVSVDGKSLGTAPVAQQTLYEGRHTVTVIGQEGWKKSQQITVVGGQTISHLVAAPR